MGNVVLNNNSLNVLRKTNWSLILIVIFLFNFFSKAETKEIYKNDQTPSLLSAFFGLDNALPFRVNRVCLGAWRKDGMPVIMSHTINAETLQKEDFNVIRKSGISTFPTCVTLRPAQDDGENRTVLLIGDFGDAHEDPPMKVEVVGDLFSDILTYKPLNFRGTNVKVIPLNAGPTLIFAEIISTEAWLQPQLRSTCPNYTKQVVRVTWSGGIRLSNGAEVSDNYRDLYSVTVLSANGLSEVVTPASIADLNDGDNNHYLCLDTDMKPINISFPEGYLVDPNQDLNPNTNIYVQDLERNN